MTSKEIDYGKLVKLFPTETPRSLSQLINMYLRAAKRRRPDLDAFPDLLSEASVLADRDGVSRSVEMKGRNSDEAIGEAYNEALDIFRKSKRLAENISSDEESDIAVHEEEEDEKENVIDDSSSESDSDNDEVEFKVEEEYSE